jgi:2'-5' RNA ligase
VSPGESRTGAAGRLRLFCALRLPRAAVDEITAWQAGELHGGRIVPAANLHLTLAFLGSRPASDLARVATVLARAAAGAGDIRLEVGDYRETRSVGMVVLADEGGEAAALADRLASGLEALGGYRREARRFLPHLTVLRFRAAPGLTPAPPRLGPISPSDAAVYSSTLRPDGARYEVLEAMPLGG